MFKDTVMNQFNIIGIDNPLHFGKYRGLTPRDIIEIDPEYLSWLIGKGFKFTKEIKDTINNLIYNKQKQICVY